LPLAAEGQQVYVAKPAKNARLTGNCDAIAGAILNLATNGLRHAGPRARLTIDSRINKYDVEIRVRDDGPGVPADKRARIFEPFFTSCPDGTGLGLAVARSVAEAHHGSLDLDNDAHGGATFLLRLPLDTQLDRRTPNDVLHLNAPGSAHTHAEEAAV